MSIQTLADFNPCELEFAQNPVRENIQTSKNPFKLIQHRERSLRKVFRSHRPLFINTQKKGRDSYEVAYYPEPCYLLGDSVLSLLDSKDFIWIEPYDDKHMAVVVVQDNMVVEDKLVNSHSDNVAELLKHYHHHLPDPATLYLPQLPSLPIADELLAPFNITYLPQPLLQQLAENSQQLPQLTSLRHVRQSLGYATSKMPILVLLLTCFLGYFGHHFYSPEKVIPPITKHYQAPLLLPASTGLQQLVTEYQRLYRYTDYGWTLSELSLQRVSAKHFQLQVTFISRNGAALFIPRNLVDEQHWQIKGETTRFSLIHQWQPMALGHNFTPSALSPTPKTVMQQLWHAGIPYKNHQQYIEIPVNGNGYTFLQGLGKVLEGYPVCLQKARLTNRSGKLTGQVHLCHIHAS